MRALPRRRAHRDTYACVMAIELHPFEVRTPRFDIELGCKRKSFGMGCGGFAGPFWHANGGFWDA